MTPHGIRFDDEQWAWIEKRASDLLGTPSDVVRTAVMFLMEPPVSRFPSVEVSDNYVRGWLEGYGVKLRQWRTKPSIHNGRPTSLRRAAEILGIRADVLHHIEHGRMMPTIAEAAVIDNWMTNT